MGDHAHHHQHDHSGHSAETTQLPSVTSINPHDHNLMDHSNHMLNHMMSMAVS